MSVGGGQRSFHQTLLELSELVTEPAAVVNKRLGRPDVASEDENYFYFWYQETKALFYARVSDGQVVKLLVPTADVKGKSVTGARECSVEGVQLGMTKAEVALLWRSPNPRNLGNAELSSYYTDVYWWFDNRQFTNSSGAVLRLGVGFEDQSADDEPAADVASMFLVEATGTVNRQSSGKGKGLFGWFR